MPGDLSAAERIFKGGKSGGLANNKGPGQNQTVTCARGIHLRSRPRTQGPPGERAALERSRPFIDLTTSSPEHRFPRLFSKNQLSMISEPTFCLLMDADRHIGIYRFSTNNTVFYVEAHPELPISMKQTTDTVSGKSGTEEGSQSPR